MNMNTDWYELWMKQNREFFTSAEKNLRDVFSKSGFSNPEEHMNQINLWLETLKNQWQFTQLKTDQKIYEDYWKMMGKLYSDASDMMLAQWIKRTQDKNPVKTIQELYELWLNCCKDVYTKSQQTKAYQEAYGEFMQAALKFWKDVAPK